MALPVESIDRHIGKKLRARRQFLGLSQKAVGDALNITFQQIQKYEHANNKISAGRLYRLAHVLGVSLNFFFDDLSDEKTGALRNDPRIIELFEKMYGYCSKEMCDSSIELMDYLRKRLYGHSA